MTLLSESEIDHPTRKLPSGPTDSVRSQPSLPRLPDWPRAAPPGIRSLPSIPESSQHRGCVAVSVPPYAEKAEQTADRVSSEIRPVPTLESAAPRNRHAIPPSLPGIRSAQLALDEAKEFQWLRP